MSIDEPYTTRTKVLDSWSLANLHLKNRIVKAATYEGMTPMGRPSTQLTEFHTKIAQGGTALTTVAYAAVDPDGRTNEEQLLLDSVSLPGLKELTSHVHRAGGKASMQLTHCGYFTRNTHLKKKPPRSASRNFNSYGALSGLPLSKAMSRTDMDHIKRAFASGAELALNAGFDAIELHMGHGYLLSQFLSRGVNRRTDAYGGSIARRARFPMEVLAAIKEVTSSDAPVIVKMNTTDGFKGGLNVNDAIEVGRALEDNGADAILTSGGYTSRSPFFLMRGDVPWRGMIRVEKSTIQKAAIALFGPFIMKQYTFSENYFLPFASQLLKHVTIPVIYSGGVISSKGIDGLLSSGFQAVAIGRALLENPNLPTALRDSAFVSPCNHCNACMVEMDRGGVKCILTQ